MSLSFMSNKAKSSAASKSAQAEETHSEHHEETQQESKQASGGFGASKKSTSMGFLKTGSAAKSAMAQEEAKAALAKEEAGKMWDFYLKDGHEARITFLDGSLDEDGMLNDTRFYQHMVQHNGSWAKFVCTADVDNTTPCPICARGNDFRSSLVGVLTVIDHTPHTIKNGPNKGTVIPYQRKLFIAKRGTIQQLTKMAGKRGGNLAGCTFDVSRTGDKEPAVGNHYDFVSQHNSIEEIAAAYGFKVDDCQPANYQEEITYLTPAELIDLGVGQAHGGIGNGGSFSSGKKSDYGNHL